MRARLLCGAILAVAVHNLAAQAPATSAPTPAPAAAKIKGPTKAEFRVTGFMISGERNYDFLNSVSSATGSIKGVEILMRASGIGLYARSLSGTFGKQPTIISADARLLLFPSVFTIYGGYGKRGLSGAVDKVYTFYSGGVSSTISIGGSGLRTNISGGMMFAPAKTTGAGGAAAAAKGASTGIEAEASILYRLPRVPLFISLGYRTETFTAKSGTVETPEEVRGLRFGGGLSFGGR